MEFFAKRVEAMHLRFMAKTSMGLIFSQVTDIPVSQYTTDCNVGPGLGIENRWTATIEVDGAIDNIEISAACSINLAGSIGVPTIGEDAFDGLTDSPVSRSPVSRRELFSGLRSSS